jgi:hypothetical protein
MGVISPVQRSRVFDMETKPLKCLFQSCGCMCRTSSLLFAREEITNVSGTNIH